MLQAHGLQNKHHNGQDDDGDDGKPGQRVPDAAVGVLAHDVFVGRDDNHKDKQNWQQNTVDDLGGHHDAKEAHAWDQNNQRRNDQDGCNNAVVDRGLLPAAVGSTLPTKCLADSACGNAW